MIVEILNTDKQTGVKKGQIYEAEPYFLEPGKVTLLQRLTKKNRLPIGKNPYCNEYRYNINIL